MNTNSSRSEGAAAEGEARREQGSAGRSGNLSAADLKDERETPDDKGRAIEHGAEQYYRDNAPDDGPLQPGDKPEEPGKVRPGRSAT